MSEEPFKKSRPISDKAVLSNEGFQPGSLFLVNKDFQVLQGDDPARSFKFFIPMKKGSTFMVCDTCVFHMDYVKALDYQTTKEVHENNQQEMAIVWDPFNPIENHSSYSRYITPVSIFVKILVEERFYYIYLEAVADYLRDWYFTRIIPPYTNTQV